VRHRLIIGKLPGYIATALVIGVTSLWTLWGVAEVYYEGWWGSWDKRVPYLVPALCCLTLSLLAITWPRVGGWMLVAIGGVFTAWWWGMRASSGLLTPRIVLGTFPVSGLLVVTGVLFLLEGRYRKRLRAGGATPPSRWTIRHLRPLLAMAVPLLVALAVSVPWAPILMGRDDDGGRGARLIEGNGVRLIWAPAGPGWSRGLDPEAGEEQPEPGPSVSWNDIALYGVAPVGFGPRPDEQGRNASAEDMRITGLCGYLSEDGSTLMGEPQGFWRMPATDEIVRSLVRDGSHAGCAWDGVSQSARCEVTPDKETPLWVPGWSPIYYWSADEYDEQEAYYVSYHGSIISYQPKSWGNPRHGYRCVREP
jgi:hypothetical protein